MNTHRKDISGGLDPDHNDKLLDGFKTIASMLLDTLNHNPNPTTRFISFFKFLFFSLICNNID